MSIIPTKKARRRVVSILVSRASFRASVVAIVFSASALSSLVSTPAVAAATSHAQTAHDNSLIAVSGQVTLLSGAPADNLTLMYFSSQVMSVPPVTATTDASGHYSFSVSPTLLIGTLLLETGGASCTNLNSHGVELSVSANLPACTYISVPMQVSAVNNDVWLQGVGSASTWQPATAANFTMPAVSYLTLRVVDSSSSLVPNASVSWSLGVSSPQVCTPVSVELWGTCSDPLGDLPRNGANQFYVPSGEATLAMYSSNNFSGVNDLGPDTLTFAGSDPADLQMGSIAMTSVAGNPVATIVLVRSLEVTGTLMSGDASPVANASVRFVPIGTSSGPSATTASDGSFTLAAFPGTGTLYLTTPGPSNCVVDGCAPATVVDQTTPPAANMRLSVTISPAGVVSLTEDPSTSLAGHGANLFLDLPMVSRVTFEVTDQVSSPVANALLKSNETDAVTSFTVGNTNQQIYWSLIPDAMTTDQNGEWTLPIFEGDVVSYVGAPYTYAPEGQLSSFTRPLAFVAADSASPTRVATQSVSSFSTSTSPVVLSLPNQEALSASLQTSSDEPIVNATVVYVPAQSALANEPTSFYVTATTNATGEVSVPAGVGSGTLYFLSGSVGGATCWAQQLTSTGLGLLTTSVATSPALPACSKISISLTVGSDGSITTVGSAPFTTPAGSPLVITLPTFGPVPMSTVDNLTRAPIPSTPISVGGSCDASLREYSLQYNPGSSMFISWCLLGDTGEVTTDSVSGITTLPQWSGDYVGAAVATAVDPSNASRADTEWIYNASPSIPSALVFALPDPPIAPSNVRASQVTASDTSVSWSAPSSDGGSPITSYQVIATPVTGTSPNVVANSSTSASLAQNSHALRGAQSTSAHTVTTVQVQVSPSALSTDIPGLSSGVTYSISVTAQNVVGASSPSNTSYRPLAPQSVLRLAVAVATVGKPLALAVQGGSGAGAVKFVLATASTSGCVLAGVSVHAARPGSCVITITKAADATYLVATVMSTIVFTLPPRPAVVSLPYHAKASALTSSSQSAVRVLAKKLLPGASVTVTGYAWKSLSLAKLRATVAEKYLLHLIKIHIVVHYVTNKKFDRVTLATTRQ